MRQLSKIISYGTERYPEQVARGLRVLNATSLGGSVFVLGFALYDAAAGLPYGADISHPFRAPDEGTDWVRVRGRPPLAVPAKSF